MSVRAFNKIKSQLLNPKRKMSMVAKPTHLFHMISRFLFSRKVKTSSHMDQG